MRKKNYSRSKEVPGAPQWNSTLCVPIYKSPYFRPYARKTRIYIYQYSNIGLLLFG